MKVSLIDVNKIIAVEFIFFPHITITPELIKAWYLHFKNCERDEFFASLHIAVADSKDKFPPTPSDVWKIIRKLRATPESLETGEKAWGDAMGNKPMSLRATETTKQMYDWDRRGQWQTEYLFCRKKEFITIYESIKEQDEIFEKQNIARKELGYGRDAVTTIASNIMKELGL